MFVRNILLVLFLIILPGNLFAAVPNLTFTKLSNSTLEPLKTISLKDLENSKSVLIFWRSDCAPCLREISMLPDITRNITGLRILLVGLQNINDFRKHIPANLPENIEITVANNDINTVLQFFAGDKKSIPLSVALKRTGEFCDKQSGILTSTKLEKWKESC